MATASPATPERPGPFGLLARHFKSHSRKDKSTDGDELSRILQQTHINSTPPRKKLPEVPSPRTPSQLQHQLLNQLSYSSSYHQYPPSKVSFPSPQQANGKPNHHVGRQQDYLPHMPMPMLSIQRDRPSSVDHTKTFKMPNPWELVPSTPASSLPSAYLTPPRPVPPMSVPVTPANRTSPKRATGVVVDPLQLPGLHQCWGTKLDGTRCTRKVGESSASPKKGSTPSKSPSPSKGRSVALDKGASSREIIVVSDSDEESGNSSDDCILGGREEYCHQHTKKINESQGFYLPGLRTSGSSVLAGERTYVNYSRFLDAIDKMEGRDEDRLKAKLRRAMSKPPSDIEWAKRGYIYIYELRDRNTATHIALKVGRSANVMKRLGEWVHQCQSKDPTLRAFFPRPPGVTQDVLPGAAGILEKGALLSHRWERLVHLELEFLGGRLEEKCVDCGRRHREIFLIPHEVGYEGVRRAVERWLSFMRMVAVDGTGGP